MSRAFWLGCQRFGTTFWSSDIYPTWEVIERQIPCGLNVAASGLAWWSSDIGGWQPLPDDERNKQTYDSLLIATKRIGTPVPQPLYGELYAR